MARGKRKPHSYHIDILCGLCPKSMFGDKFLLTFHNTKTKASSQKEGMHKHNLAGFGDVTLQMYFGG